MNILSEIKNDIGKFTQTSPAPKSMTVVEGEYFRHYEFGPIHGFCLYNDPQMIKEDLDVPWFGVMLLEEDDGFWYVPDKMMCMSTFWINAVSDTFARLKDWYNKHIEEGRDESGEWVTRLKGPVREEIQL